MWFVGEAGSGLAGWSFNGINQEALPENAAELCSGRVALAMTRVWPYPTSVAWRVEHFTSKQDLVAAMLASRCDAPTAQCGFPPEARAPCKPTSCPAATTEALSASARQQTLEEQLPTWLKLALPLE